MAKSWEYQKEKIERRYNPTPKDIKQIILSAANPQERYFLCITYLTGGRVQEVIALRKEDFTRTEKKGIPILLIMMKNEKNRRVKQKLIPIRMDFESDLANIVLRYIVSKEGSLLSFKTRQRGWQIFRKYGLNPHFFRHMRATHLVIYRGFTGPKLKIHMGWSDSRPEDIYVHLRWEDLI